ncbi:hypothetical protein PG993_009556 [Apiospora rasikravindrae]|uniref:Uncharacterized protein n=1 Tax=Apiospora rasikravindrae TaxID=990691 RepID=A0ABR1SJQ4_9PEZI
MGENQESDMHDADVAMATIEDDVEVKGHVDHCKTYPSNDDQTASVDEPEIDQALAIDIANKAEGLLQPEEAPEMAPPASVPAKRGRGRPRKYPRLAPKTDGSDKGTPASSNLEESLSIDTPLSKRPRGRPRKNSTVQSPSIATTPARKPRSGVTVEFEASPLSAGRRNLRVPVATGMDSDEDNTSPGTTFSPINHRRRIGVTFGNHIANGDAFGPDLKSKLRQALFENAMEYDGGVHIPEDLAKGLHQCVGAGLPVPQGELFIHASLAQELRDLFL